MHFETVVLIALLSTILTFRRNDSVSHTLLQVLNDNRNFEAKAGEFPSVSLLPIVQLPILLFLELVVEEVVHSKDVRLHDYNSNLFDSRLI